jgi:hypothetical protein
MIRVPNFVTEKIIGEAKKTFKENRGIKEANDIKLETFNEGALGGLSAQMMHIGPYSEEGLIAQRLHDFIEENGYKMRGLHSEIYMLDPRRVPPERLKTIRRQHIEKL